MTFTQETTSGYTDAQLAEINDKWTDVAERLGLEDETDEYYETYDRFCNAVCHCDHITESGIDWVSVYVRMNVAAIAKAEGKWELTRSNTMTNDRIKRNVAKAMEQIDNRKRRHAASKDLLKACRQALTAARMDEWDGAGSVRYEAFELLVAAIAKAEGK